MDELPKKELLRPDEVAKYFSVSVRTVLRWVREKKIKAVRVVGVTRIPKKEVIKAQKCKDNI